VSWPMPKTRRAGRSFTPLLAGLASIIALAPPSLAGEEQVINAFSTWEGSGQMVQTGPKVSTFVGTFTGAVYVESDEDGPLYAGTMTCPAVVEVNLEDGSQTAKGDCAIDLNNGPRVFAGIACTGFYLLGCRGDITIRGGTGKLEGVSGSGPVIFRSHLHEMALAAGQPLERRDAGIAIFRNLKVVLPDAASKP
jgi:hypothetical protein